jgi:tetratricopeptide (TPR) repeat protein
LEEANPTYRVLAYIAPYRGDRELAKELDKLQDMVDKLQRSLEANPQLRLPHTEATLMQCAREAIEKGTTFYEENPAAGSIAGGRRAANGTISVAEWLSSLESIRRDQQRLDPLDTVVNVPSIPSGNEAHTTEISATSTQRVLQEREAVDAGGDNSDDDLDTDLAKAALDTGLKAFEVQEWEEADSLLLEALQVLQQLPKQQRAFCDIFDLQYRLAVCAYHLRESAEAKEALTSLIQQSASSDEQRGYIYDAVHLLSLLYIRTGQVDRALSECEKALQGRRRLLGKRNDASLESTALMAHMCVLLNNSARAKSYLAMIPEARRDVVVKNVERSLGTKVELLESPSLPTRSISEGSDLAVHGIQSRLSASSLALPVSKESRLSASSLALTAGNRFSGPVTAMNPQSPAASLRDSHQFIPSNKAGLEDLKSAAMTSFSSPDDRNESRATKKGKAHEDHPTDPEAPAAAPLSLGETLSRKEILERIGCQPRDRIEDAVCDGDHPLLASLLDKKKGFWKSKVRKRMRSERVTALHFAALFGEIDMARRLLSSSFNINEVPYGYTTQLTPLKFAIGARQVDMVEFLIANGARPSEPDSWSTLAGQLMNRSWLMKTMSEGEKEYVPNRILLILGILIKHGWDVNAPFETSGGTVLHQAVTFWTGSYIWDLDLRAAVTSFLCERGADPFQTNTEGKTPYYLALVSGHQDLLLVLARGSKPKGPDNGVAELSV